MAHGELFVIISGQTKMPPSYVVNLALETSERRSPMQVTGQALVQSGSTTLHATGPKIALLIAQIEDGEFITAIILQMQV